WTIAARAGETSKGVFADSSRADRLAEVPEGGSSASTVKTIRPTTMGSALGSLVNATHRGRRRVPLVRYRRDESADVAELVDAHGSGPCGGNFVEVRVLSSASWKRPA